MPRVFISNTKVQETENDIVFNSGKGIEQFPLVEKADDTIFVINVHCSFIDADKMQKYGGVIIYRHLLKQFEKCQDKLKVVFYSPIPKEDLVKLKPENYILKLLPFVECNYEGKEQFETDLKEAEKQVCPQFNNASENLLSGWALANKEKIIKGHEPEKLNTNGKKILFIDDQQSEWKSTYDVIFENTTILNIKNAGGVEIQTQTAYRQKLKSDWNSFIKLVKHQAEKINPDLILSDLYLEENHEETKPFKTLADIETISGFKIFDVVKSEFPYLPYMIYTTSNKVWNVEAFRSKGVWAWTVKDNTTNLSKEDKLAQFIYFTRSINKLINFEWDFVARVWKDVIKLKKTVDAENDKTKIWWYSDCPNALEIIKDCLITLDSVYAQRSSYESTNISDFEARQCFQIFNNLGGLCELLQIHFNGTKKKTVGVYIFLLRSFYSHQLFYKSAKALEAIFCIDLLLKLLELDIANFNQQPKNVKFVLERSFVKNTNFNYLLQLESLVATVPQLKYDATLFLKLKNSYNSINNDIISGQYKKTVIDHQKVITLVDQYINNLNV